ncbi:hypothetical protein MRB53_004631 [Persea americana]|uniref:Uncharacterized protein n=1 Tax=Persea americana TaxID=3435 RepID=A0ACC2MBT0_PERAE|nr:hypothetical protein MRB53_004631 [Persea americana]
METLRAASSPTSFQLRLGFRCKKSTSLIHLRMNFRPSARRIWSLSASAGSATARDGSESAGDRGRSGNSWMSSGSEADSFSGWLDKDSEDSERNRGFQGMVGAGLAGIFLAAGVTFASLALSKRSSGLRKQMEPLTTRQEVLLASDDLNDIDNQVGNEHNTGSTDDGRMQNDRGSEFKTGINQDSDSSVEITEATSDSRPDDSIHFGNSLIQNAQSDYNDIDTISEASSEEKLQFIPGADAVSVVTGSNPNSNNLVEPDVVNGSSDAFTFTDSHSFMSSEKQDPVSELEESQGTVELVELPVSSSDSTNLSVDIPDGISFSVEIENSKLPSELVCAPDGQLLSKPPTLDGLVTSESNANVESQVESKDVVKNVASVSSEQTLEVSATLQFPSEGISLLSEERNLDEIGAPGTTSASMSEDLYGNEPDINAQSEINRSRLLFESTLPENFFSFAGIPAPSLLSAALQVPPGKVLVPAVVDQVQGHTLSALQVLKVIEADVKPGDLCTRREYARWLVTASSVLSRSTTSKIYPAMYIENVTELAFDDVSPEDPDFPSIQGLAEAGLISSKLSRRDLHESLDRGPVLFSSESPLSRQDLISWKMVERKQLPEVDKKILSQCSGFIDVDKINPDAWPAIVADLSSGDQSIIALAFGFTRLFQPDKPVTKAQAAIALATCDAAELVSEELARIEAESMAETAVAAHTDLVAQVEKDLNASFEKELAAEKEKINSLEKLAAEAKLELERLRAERNEENNALMQGRAAVESEMEILTRLRREVEEQLQSLTSDKMETAFERDRINKLRQESESENQAITKLQYDLEVERKALSMARAWAEDEARRVQEHAKALEEARNRWEMHGIKVVVDDDLRDDATAGVTWLNPGKESPMDETIVNRAENLVKKLKVMAGEIKGKSSTVIEKIIQRIKDVILVLKQKAAEVARDAEEFRRTVALKVSSSIVEVKQNTAGFSANVKDGAKRLAEDCRDGVEKITQKFKT